MKSLNMVKLFFLCAIFRLKSGRGHISQDTQWLVSHIHDTYIICCLSVSTECIVDIKFNSLMLMQGQNCGTNYICRRQRVVLISGKQMAVLS